jgi:hypothetical protein
MTPPGTRLLRGLLLLLACLVAALPVGLCLCGHRHDPAPEQHEECHCHDSPRVALLPAIPEVIGDSPLSLPPDPSDFTPALPLVVRPAFRSESPPGRLPIPLYLFVGRLLI